MKKQMRFLIIIILFTYFIFLVFSVCFANSVEESLAESEKIISSAALESENIKAVYEKFDFSEITKKLTKGENVFNPEKIMSYIFDLLFGELRKNIRVLTALTVLALVGGIISSLQSSFNSKGTAEAAFFVFYTVYVGILVNSFYSCLESAQAAIGQQSAFLKAATPVYISMLVMSGKTLSSGASSSILLYFISLISSAVNTFLVPLSLVIFIMSVVNNISGKIHITRFVSFIRFIVTRALALMMTAFVSLMTLSGIGAKSVDNFALRAAKYAAQNFVPVVGGILSGTIDTVFASAEIVKNACGVAGIIAIFAISAYPTVKFAALILIYKFAASIIEPIADKRIANAANEAASGISLLFSFVVCVTVGFSISVAVLAGIGV